MHVARRHLINHCVLIQVRATVCKLILNNNPSGINGKISRLEPGLRVTMTTILIRRRTLIILIDGEKYDTLWVGLGWETLKRLDLWGKALYSCSHGGPEVAWWWLLLRKRHSWALSLTASDVVNSS